MKTVVSNVAYRFYYYSYFYFKDKVRAICDAVAERSFEPTLEGHFKKS